MPYAIALIKFGHSILFSIQIIAIPVNLSFLDSFLIGSNATLVIYSLSSPFGFGASTKSSNSSAVISNEDKIPFFASKTQASIIVLISPNYYSIQTI